MVCHVINEKGIENAPFELIMAIDLVRIYAINHEQLPDEDKFFIGYRVQGGYI